MLPSRRKRPKMGVREPERLIFPTHRQFVKRFGCVITGCFKGPIEFAHLRTAANSGMGRKPRDDSGIGLCREHHARAHNIGHDAMARENGMTLEQLFALARGFAKSTSDKAMREALRQESVLHVERSRP